MKNTRAELRFLLAACAAWFGWTANARTLDVTAYGAKPDGATDNTAAIQKAIDDCSAAGGGRVLVPGGGVYKTYTLNLKNGVDLHLERGATLKGGEDPLKYPLFAPTDVWHVERSPRFNRRAMFYTCGQTNVAITGSGTIDGNAEAYHHRVDGVWQRISHTNITGRCVFFAGCRDVRFDDVLVYHPCGWSTWFLDCDRVQVKGVRVECHREFPNGDGLHFGGCRDVTVSDCLIDAQDDALIVRTHQEQMRAVRPCERMTFANCVLRSNQSAIRIGWTGDGPLRDITFDNIVCSYSRLGVQFFLPRLLEAPATCVDPPRGHGLPVPPPDTLAPFSVENMRFSNMSINSFGAPFYVDIGRTENVAFLRDISFSHCRFTSQQPPIVNCRTEDGVRDWRFSDVTFDIARPRGQAGVVSGIGHNRVNGFFENARDIVLDNVKWTWREQDLPEWHLALEQYVGAASGQKTRARHLAGSRQACAVETPAPGVRRFTYDALTDGQNTWNVKVVLEERVVQGDRTYTGRIENRDAGIRVTAFEGPYYDRLRVDPVRATLYFPEGLGRRLTFFPKENDPKIKAPVTVDANWSSNRADWFRRGDGRYTFDTGFHPGGIDALSMGWCAFDTGFGTYAAVAQDAQARPKRLRLRWNPLENRADLAFDCRMFLAAGETYSIPELRFSKLKGDWHEAARAYRAWWDTCHDLRAAAPDWTKDIAGWLLVILRQQNEKVIWSYHDIPKICDVAQRYGLDTIGLFGWTQGGHDHLYPDYHASAEMGGEAALKAGIAEAHRRGLKVCIYANGQLQQVGATKFWDEHGKNFTLIKADGTPVIQSYHKFSDIPKYEFGLGCLYGKAWHDRMESLAVQAGGFGADSILYDQYGIFSPFACYGRGHGHPTPCYSYSEERPAFIRSIADAMRKRNPSFAVFTEGFHDTILDSIAFFHGCTYGTFNFNLEEIAVRAAGARSKTFPELARYTFPELISTTRYGIPMMTRSGANYGVVFGLRHDVELRYGPDRTYVLEGKIPVRADFGTANDPSKIDKIASEKPAVAAAYLKGVCDFQRAHAKYLLRGRFVDTDGFACTHPALVAKRYVAADGTSAVCVWNLGKRPVPVNVEGLGAPAGVFAPAGESTEGPLAADSLRLYVFSR